MKYKLINTQTKEEHLCDKVTIGGFDYYVSDEEINNIIDWTICIAADGTPWMYKPNTFFKDLNSDPGYKKVIATNNPIIDVPKVANEVDELAALKYLNENPKNIGFEIEFVGEYI